jgi:hypothetical protein
MHGLVILVNEISFPNPLNLNDLKSLDPHVHKKDFGKYTFSQATQAKPSRLYLIPY